MSINIWKLSTLGVAGLFVATVAYNHTNTAAAAPDEAIPYNACDDQGHMESALEHLRAARHELYEAKANKGGERAAAIEKTGNAIKDVKRGCKFADDKRDSE